MGTTHYKSTLSRAQSRRGAILPLLAFLFPLVVIMLGFSIDLALMQNSRAELRAAADAAARAGAIELARSADPDLTRGAAVQMASLNTVMGQQLSLRDEDVEIGNSQENGAGELDVRQGRAPVEFRAGAGQPYLRIDGRSYQVVFQIILRRN